MGVCVCVLWCVWCVMCDVWWVLCVYMCVWNEERFRVVHTHTRLWIYMCCVVVCLCVCVCVLVCCIFVPHMNHSLTLTPCACLCVCMSPCVRVLCVCVCVLYLSVCVRLLYVSYSASPTCFPCVVLHTLRNDHYEILRRSSTQKVPKRDISAPETIEFPSKHGNDKPGKNVAYGYYYPPTNPRFKGLVSICMMRQNKLLYEMHGKQAYTKNKDIVYTYNKLCYY